MNQISSHPAVRRVVALGTLFALELHAEGSNAGYGFSTSFPCQHYFFFPLPIYLELRCMKHATNNASRSDNLLIC